MVQKPDGRLRPCGDFRGLNNITVKNRYPLLSFRSFTHRLAGATVFSKINLKKAYFQLPLSKDSIPKTAIITPFGCFEFLVLPFGLCNAVASFQRLSDTIFANFPFVFCYLDDLIVFSANEEQHEDHLRRVFQKLWESGLAVNKKKCSFFQAEVEYLGHIISSGGAKP